MFKATPNRKCNITQEAVDENLRIHFDQKTNTKLLIPNIKYKKFNMEAYTCNILNTVCFSRVEKWVPPPRRQSIKAGRRSEISIKTGIYDTQNAKLNLKRKNKQKGKHVHNTGVFKKQETDF